MQKNRIIAISVVAPGRPKADGVSYRWVHTLAARYLSGGWDAIGPHGLVTPALGMRPSSSYLRFQ